jgi:hypothetical protein
MNLILHLTTKRQFSLLFIENAKSHFVSANSSALIPLKVVTAGSNNFEAPWWIRT